MSRTRYTQSGFSLVELIVAMAVFTIVITITLGALLMLVGTNQQLQGQQSMMTNLSFALDSMTREIRTGTNYYCDSQNGINGGSAGKKLFSNGTNLDADAYLDCANGNDSNRTYHGISFIEGGESITNAPDTRIVYFFDASEHKIYRRVSGGNAESIVSSGIYIENAEFFVTGTDPLDPANNEYQATVTIIIEAKESSDSTEDPTVVQTTITQRTLDI
jgi:prepilin-type N-terminal cleavage/methylation domain-containing protein